MEPMITDYVKFLSEAREAVYRLNSDTDAEARLRIQEGQQQRELEAVKKEIEESIARTIKQRTEEISSSYDKEIGKEQERLKRARARREKAKSKGVKERIADETKALRDENRDLQLQMKTWFQKDRVPGFFRSSFYYTVFYPSGLKEYALFLLTMIICFLAIPCGIYFLIPGRKLWQLILIYFLDVLLLGGFYIKLGNFSRRHYEEALRHGRAFRSSLRTNRRKMASIARDIKRDGNEDIYNLEKFDDEISCVEQELFQISKKKKEALVSFENVTKNIIADEIQGSRKSQLEQLESQLQETENALLSLEKAIKDQNIYITDIYGPYLGKEFLEPDKLEELSKLISDGVAANITEAIEIVNRRKIEKSEE